jgi:site-specific DNA-methyltransferase (adenine-specific)
MTVKPYYSEDGITIYNADCREVLPQLEPVDLVLTDPPFGEKTHAGMRNGHGENSIDFASVGSDFISDVFERCAPRRWLISSIDWRHAAEIEAKPPAGLEFVRLGVWVKRNPMPQLTGDRPATGWEGIAFLHSLATKKRWNGGGASACYDFGTSRWGYFGPSLHPTEKPLPLISKLLSQFAEKSETVLDPFMGSGTTLRAAKDLGLKAIGIEIERKYCDIAIERLRQQAFSFQEAA